MALGRPDRAVVRQTTAKIGHSPFGGAGGGWCYQPYTLNGVAPSATNGIVYRHVGDKYYELKDHLGNVRVVVSDRKNLNTADNSLSAHVVSYNNYYPFGMPQPNRNFDSQEYRYGFQGQEKDSEIKGEGLSVNYKYRMQDTRLGRFFTVDPYQRAFPWNSSYSFAENRVVRYSELEGAEIYDPQLAMYMAMKWAKIKKKFSNGLENAVQASTTDKMNIGMGNYDAPTRDLAEMQRVSRLIGGLTDMAEVTEDVIVGAAETVNTIPGVDTVGDPLLALYFGARANRTGDTDDIISAGAYTTASLVPFASGAVIKLTGKGAVQLLKKSTKYNFKVAGRVRDDILNSINNPNLKNAFNELYRPNASIGNGGTAAAVIEEGAGGVHYQKAIGYRENLRKLLTNCKGCKNTADNQRYFSANLSDDDAKIANQLFQELDGAIKKVDNANN